MEKKWYKSGNMLLSEIETSILPIDMASVWYIGQVGFVVKIGGIICYFDPILSSLIAPDGSLRTNYPPPFNGETIQDADYVFCSHNHGDHIDITTLVAISKGCAKTKFIVPAPFVSHLIQNGISSERVIGAKEEQAINLTNDIFITPIASAHEEYIKDKNGDQISLGYILQNGAIKIYHSGDTVVTSLLVERLNNEHGISLAFLPINGADYKRRTLLGMLGNMNARDAADLAYLAKIDMVIPCHYDMFTANCENPAVFAGYMNMFYSNCKYHIMALGERFIYSR